jgi:hypothetical protein
MFIYAHLGVKMAKLHKLMSFRDALVEHAMGVWKGFIDLTSSFLVSATKSIKITITLELKS